MALLPQPGQQTQEQDPNAPKALDTSVPKQPALTQPQTAQPSQAQQSSVARPTIQANQPVRKGSGFTNLQSLLKANQGNRLGAAVGGGIAGQQQKFQQGVQKSQASFTEEANKNRLDTPEAAAKRAEVLGRFDENRFQVYDSSKQQPQAGLAQPSDVTTQTTEQAAQPQQQGIDLAKFKISEGVQSQYEQGKAAQEAAQKAAQDLYSKQQSSIEKERQEVQNALNAMTAPAKSASSGGGVMGDFGNLGTTNLGSLVGGVLNKNQKSAYQNSLKTLTNLQSTLEANKLSAEKQAKENLADLESQYGKLSEAERNAYIQSERDRLTAENLPSADEMERFRKYQTGAYEGPKELQDFGALLGRAQQTESLGNLARTEGGREELLKQFVGGRKDYTSGQRGLDLALLGRGDTSALTQAARATRGAEEEAVKANRAAQAEAQGYISKAKQFGEETTKQIEAAQAPLSERINQQLEQLKAGEATRAKDVGTLQGILTGNDANTKSLDAQSRLGIALQGAQDAGYLDRNEVRALTAKGGLIDRATKLGLDPNALIAERIQSKAMVGADRAAAATADQEKRMNALDRLMGRVGTDVEFERQPTSQFEAGKTSFDLNSLADYIKKTEGEKMQGGEIAAYKQAGLTPMQQMMAGAGQTLNAITNTPAGLAAGGIVAAAPAAEALAAGITGSASAGAGSAMAGAAPYALLAMLGIDALTGGDTTAQTAEGVTQLGTGAARGVQGLSVSALKELQKLAGNNKQLGQVAEAYDKASSGLITGVSNEAMNAAGGLRDLTQTGRLDQALAKLSGAQALQHYGQNLGNIGSKALSDIGKTASTALFGGETGNWATSDYKVRDVETGKNVALKKMANQSSDKLLKQILEGDQLGALSNASDKRKQGQSYARLNLLMNYYKNALAREGKA